MHPRLEFNYPSNQLNNEEEIFGRAKLIDLFLHQQVLPLSQQRDLLNNAIVEWQGEGEQSDDITVIGLRL